MWNDIEATDDLLNFTVLANTAAQLIRDSSGQPISIGVSGNWGSGKSSFLKLVDASLRRESRTSDKFIFIEFNAWLYQGFEDARLALLQTISDAVLAEARKRETLIDKALGYAKRIRWLRLGRALTPIATGAVLGGSFAGPLGALVGAVGGIVKAGVTPAPEDIEKVRAAYEELEPEFKDLLKEKADDSMPKEIAGLRKALEEILRDLDVTLVVLVDDLDRCLPETAISTLEAMRLLLFVPRTAFIIAADERLIRNSVRKHFGSTDLSEDLVTSYFDKLIQVPLRVPRLGVTEVKAYLVLLFADLAVRQHKITDECRMRAQGEILAAVRKAWAGGLTRRMLGEAFDRSAEVMAPRLDLADQLAPIMANSDQIAGNPRLIKRFLNQLMIRDAVARAHGITVAFEELVKLLVFERCASPAGFEYLARSVAEASDGKPEFLKRLEQSLASGQHYQPPDTSWESPFYSEWLRLPPALDGIDLRPLIYLSRDKSPQIAGAESLSEKARSLLEAVLEAKSPNAALANELKKLGEPECEQILLRLFRRARADQWSSASIIKCVHVTQAFPGLGMTFVSLLAEVPADKRPAALIPLIRSEPWAANLLASWAGDPQSPAPVRVAAKLRADK